MGVKITSNKKGVTKEANKRAGATLADFAELMAGFAKEGSPKLTGHNARSITFVAPKGKKGVRVFTESGYGGYLEIGTKRMSPRPYFRPAWDKAVKRLPALMETHK